MKKDILTIIFTAVVLMLYFMCNVYAYPLEDDPIEKDSYEKINQQQSQKDNTPIYDIVTYANYFVGYPYVYGGNSLTKGIDCSHFVYKILLNTGHYNGKYVTSSHWAYLGEPVASLEQAIAGDIIVYSGHVAIYDGEGKLIEAQAPGVGITNTRKATSAYIIAIRRFE